MVPLSISHQFSRYSTALEYILLDRSSTPLTPVYPLTVSSWSNPPTLSLSTPPLLPLPQRQDDGGTNKASLRCFLAITC